MKRQPFRLALSFAACIALSAVSAPAFASGASRDDGQIAAGPTSSPVDVRLAREFAVRSASRDLRSFCVWNRMQRAADLAARDPILGSALRRHRFNGDRRAYEDILIQVYSLPFIGWDPWAVSMLGSPRVKEDVRHATFATRLLSGHESPGNAALDVPEWLRAFETRPTAHPDALPFMAYRRMPDVSLAMRSAACAQFSSLSNVGQCASALDVLKPLLAVADSGTGTATIGISILKEALSDEYSEGLRLAAIGAFRRMRDGSLPPQANVFDDVKNGFIEGGSGPEDAEDRAFVALAAISTGGPNVLTRASHQERATPNVYREGRVKSNAIYLQALAEAMVHLDTQAMLREHSRPYSMPAGFSFPCDAGKSYHFWSNAHLARELAKRGFKTEATRSALAIAHIAYQLGGFEGSERNSDRIFIAPRYGVVENGIRLDMTLAAAGAGFGADRARGRGSSHEAGRGFALFLQKGSDDPEASPNLKLGPLVSALGGVNGAAIDQARIWTRNLDPAFIFGYFLPDEPTAR